MISYIMIYSTESKKLNSTSFQSSFASDDNLSELQQVLARFFLFHKQSFLALLRLQAKTELKLKLCVVQNIAT